MAGDPLLLSTLTYESPTGDGKSEILVVLFLSAREKAFGDFSVYLPYEFLWFLVTSVAPPVSNAALWTCQLSCYTGRQSFWYKHPHSSHETTVRLTFCCRETYMHLIEMLKVVLAGRAGGPVLGMPITGFLCYGVVHSLSSFRNFTVSINPALTRFSDPAHNVTIIKPERYLQWKRSTDSDNQIWSIEGDTELLSSFRVFGKAGSSSGVCWVKRYKRSCMTLKDYFT